jgi:hypothetical protein
LLSLDRLPLVYHKQPHNACKKAAGTWKQVSTPSGLGAPAARPPGTLWGLFGTPQPPAWDDHPHTAPRGRGGRGGDGHGIAALELGTATEARLCTRYGTLPMVSKGVATDHRRHHAGRGHQKDPLPSETRGRPAPNRTGACQPGSLRLVLRLTMPGMSQTPHGALARECHTAVAQKSPCTCRL